jgi:hypothetical protein
MCGAVVLLDDKVAADKCPYCGVFLENRPETAQGMIAPGALLPFAVTERHARDAFNRWIATRWFAPNGLYQFANLGKLAGVYAPFWTFDSMTCTHYTGQRGDDYTETETYTERDSNGQEVTRTRQVTRTRWTSVYGEIRHFFDDVLVYASQSLPEKHVVDLAPWDLPKVENFREEFLSGFQTERYTVGLQDGFDKARGIMDAEIRRLCMRDIGGDHQQLHTVHTQHIGITFKHILLPFWVAAYRYHNQPYRVLVNGQTGKVVGTRPYSWIKITVLILALLGAALVAFLLFSRMARDGSTSHPSRAFPRFDESFPKLDRPALPALGEGLGFACLGSGSLIQIKLHSHHRSLVRWFNDEPQSLNESEHRSVLAQHQSGQPFYAAVAGDIDKPPHEQPAQSAALIGVVHDNGKFRGTRVGIQVEACDPAQMRGAIFIPDRSQGHLPLVVEMAEPNQAVA